MTVAQAYRAAAPSGRWGLYDARGDLWVGSPEGIPLRYDDAQVARLAAQAVAGTLRWPIARILVRDLDAPPARTPLDAFRELAPLSLLGEA